MKIPLVDLGPQNREVAAEAESAMREVVARADFVLGPAVAEFEEAFARYSGAAHCVGTGNGGDALELLLRALDVGPADEVLLPVNTFVATALAVHRTGARPVLVDSDPLHHLIDPAAVEDRVGRRTRAIVAVHLYGQMAPMEPLARIAGRHGLHLVTDAAQSQGARQGGRPLGSFGAGASTSFYPGKNLGAFGDAGAVVTNDPSLAERLQRLRNYGSDRKYHHPEIGFNSRLDTLQAAVLRAKLERLDAWNQARRRAAALYGELLGEIPEVTRPSTLPGNEHVWHLYVVQVPERDRVLQALHDAGVGASIHYPIPIHQQGAFAWLDHRPGDFPTAERAAREILSLPVYPGITEAQQREVVAALRSALRS